MTITQTGRRVALVGLLALIAAMLPFTGASAIDGTEALQLSADDNVATSIANSQVVYTPVDGTPDNPPTTVLIGREDVFADNLAAGALQDNAPLLLTESDALNADVEAEITRLGATEAKILGGEAAISADVQAELEALLGADNVSRLSGPTRTETAIAVATDSGATTALLVRSEAAADSTDATQAYADSLGAGALAASCGCSILFTQTETLTQTTADYLASEDGPDTVIIVGGTAAVSEGVETAVGEIDGVTVSRTSGPTRFDTAVELNGLRETVGSFAIAVEGQAADAWADGFTAANLSGLNDAPLVLTNNGDVPQATEDYLTSINDNAYANHLADTFVVCGASAGAACDVLADLYNLTVVPFPAPQEPVSDNEGIIIAFDIVADDYEFQPAEGDAVVVEYDSEDDTFSVDGTPSTFAIFEANLSVGDSVVFTADNGDGGQDHALTNAEPAETGTVGNVDSTSDTFEIIEPVSGAFLGGPIDYVADCDLYNVDGTVVIQAQFGADLNEGDVFDVSEDAAANVTCMLDNGTVAGTASGVVGAGGPVVDLMVGNLGDDFASAQDDTFTLTMADFDAGDLEIMVDGEAITDFADFSDVVSDGDQVTYEREDGTVTVSLTNASPTTISGQAVAGLGGNTFDIATNPGSETVSYVGAPDTVFIVDGISSSQAEFETAYTPGDAVSYTPEDVAAGDPETVTLSNQDLVGAVDEDSIAIGASEFDGGSYGVLSTSGDVLLDTVGYITPPGDRLYVNGAEVTEETFEESLTDIAAGDATGTMTVDFDNVIAGVFEHFLETA